MFEVFVLRFVDFLFEILGLEPKCPGPVPTIPGLVPKFWSQAPNPCLVPTIMVECQKYWSRFK